MDWPSPMLVHLSSIWKEHTEVSDENHQFGLQTGKGEAAARAERLSLFGGTKC